MAKNFFYKNNKRFLSTYSIILLIFVVALITKNYFQSSPLYKSFFEIYSGSVMHTANFILNFIIHDSRYLSDKIINPVNSIIYPLHTNFSLSYNIMLFFILIAIPERNKKDILLFFSGLIFLFVISVLKCIIEVINYNELGDAISGVIIATRPIMIVYALKYKIDKNTYLKDIYNKTNNYFKDRLVFSLIQFILILIIIIPLTYLFEIVSYNCFNFIYSKFTHSLLWLSQFSLKSLNYSTVIVGKYIYLGKYSVYLDKPCLGLGITLTFIFIILSIKSNCVNKFLYIISGSFIMYLMNSIRISYLLIHLSKYGRYTLSLTVHELSDYFFYTIVFFMIVIYLLWFQNIDLSFSNQNKLKNQNFK